MCPNDTRPPRRAVCSLPAGHSGCMKASCRRGRGPGAEMEPVKVSPCLLAPTLRPSTVLPCVLGNVPEPSQTGSLGNETRCTRMRSLSMAAQVHPHLPSLPSGAVEAKSMLHPTVAQFRCLGLDAPVHRESFEERAGRTFLEREAGAEPQWAAELPILQPPPFPPSRNNGVCF